MKAFVLIVLILMTTQAQARGYSATYDMIWSVGIRLETEATETLLKTDGNWQMTLDAKASIGSATETTNLIFDQDNGWTPLDYSYTQSVLGRTKGRHFRFNWNKESLSRLHEPEQSELPMDPGTLDPLGFRLHLAHLLQQGKAPPTQITMLSGNGLKTREMASAGEEVIETPMGSFNTLKFALLEDDPKRSFEFWLAPELDYQLVKLETRDNKRMLALTLTSYTPAGTP